MNVLDFADCGQVSPPSAGVSRLNPVLPSARVRPGRVATALCSAADAPPDSAAMASARRRGPRAGSPAAFPEGARCMHWGCPGTQVPFQKGPARCKKHFPLSVFRRCGGLSVVFRGPCSHPPLLQQQARLQGDRERRRGRPLFLAAAPRPVDKDRRSHQSCEHPSPQLLT